MGQKTMVHPQFSNDLISVTASIDQDGNTHPTQLTWRGKSCPLIAVGRQWETESGRHILAEAGDGTRYELLLSRQELVWRLKRYWPMALAA